MKFYKISQSGGGDGIVVVRLTTNKRTGEFRAEVVGHENGAKCSDGVDHDILEDLLSAEVEGFGDLMIKTDEGNTPEFYEEKGAKKGAPMVAKPSKGQEMTPLTTPKGKQKQLDKGFGV